MSVRLYKDGDFEALCALFDAYRIFYGQVSDLAAVKAFIQRRLEKQDSIIHVYDDGGLKGYAQMYHSLSSVQMRPTLILNDLFVSPAYRRQGVALALLEETRRFAKDSGVARLGLATGAGNIEARAAYEKFGYKKDPFIYYVLEDL